MEAPSARDEIIIDFLKGLRIVLNNAAAYPKEHPYFVKSAETYKEKVDALLELLNPIQFTCTPDSLFIDGRAWKKEALYVDLAQMFHFRKIKGVQISRGVTLDEIIAFVGVIGMPKRDVIREGGANVLLSAVGHPHLVFEELDYSQFLTDGDMEVDVWMYFIRQAMDKNDTQKIMQFADTFGAVVRKIKIEDIMNDGKLRAQISRFMGYLNDTNKDKMKECARGLYGTLVRYKEALCLSDVDKVRDFFGNIDEKALGEILWNEMAHDAQFDVASLNVFAHLSSGRKPEAVGAALGQAAQQDSLQAQPDAVERIKRLIDTPNWDSVSEVYRNTIASLAQRIKPTQSLVFSRAELKVSYQHLLLVLASIETDVTRLKDIAGRMVKDWDSLANEGDSGYLLALAELLPRRAREVPLAASVFADIQKRMTHYVEALVWDPGAGAVIDKLIPGIQSSTKDADFYLDKIFNDGKGNARVFLLFFHLFPAELGLFYQGIDGRRHDIPFLVELIKSLREVENPQAHQALRHVFSVSNAFIKIEVLKSLRVLSAEDEHFLLELVKSGDLPMKRAALSALRVSPQAGYPAAKILFDVPNFMGFNNTVVLERIALAEEYDLRDARAYLVVLSAKKMFWFASVSRKAMRILEKWNA